MKLKKIVVGGFLSGMALTGLAKTCTWKGGNGDWNLPGNWEGGAVPENGDTVSLKAGASAATINNGLTGLVLTKICFLEGAAITLTGNRYTLDGTGDVWSNACVVTHSAPLKIAKGCNFVGNSAVSFDGETEIGEAKVHFNVAETMTFNGVVNAPEATITGKGKAIVFNDKVTANTVQAGGDWASMNVTFNVAGNNVAFVTSGGWGNVYAKKANAFGARSVFTYDTYAGVNNKSQGFISLTGNQEVDRVESGKPKYVGVQQGLTGSITVTQKATADATTYCWLWGKISLVWDPVGDFVQTLCCSNNTTTGSLTVKRGTLKIGEEANYTDLTGINVDGGTFVVDSSADVVFGALQTLKMDEGTKFQVTESASALPFGGSAVDGKMAYGAKLQIAEGKTLTFSRLEVVGTLPTAGTYTGVGYGVEGVSEVPWIEGAGRVVVANTGLAVTVWKAAQSGNWNDAANWTAGVPTADTEALISAQGADYTVTVDGTPTMPKRLVVANDDSHTATLSVQTAVRFSAAYIELMNGGKVTVPASGDLLYSGYDNGGTRMMAAGAGYPIRVNAGATLEVNGGSVTLTNVCGDVLVCGNGSKTGTVAVTSGRFYYSCDFNQQWSNVDFFILNPKGAILQTGGVMLFEHSKGGSSTVFKNQGGFLSVDDGTFGTVTEKGGHSYWAYFNFGGGENAFGGSSVFYTDGTFMMTPLTADDELSLTFRGQSEFRNSSASALSQLTIGNRGRTHFNVFNDFCRSAVFAVGAFVGCNGGFADVNVVGDGVLNIGGRGLQIGFDDGPTKSSAGVSGEVNVADGGRLFVEGIGSDGYTSSYLCGLSIGYGACTAIREGRPYDGALNVCGGAVTNRYGDFVVGVGYATGRLLLDGGTVLANTCELASNIRTFGVGLAGGVGACTVSNGTLRVPCNAFIGGANTNAFYGSMKLAAAGWPVDRHDAEGTMTVAGGSVEFGRSLVLGADGRGTLAMSGAEGAVSVAGDLVLSNAVENVDSGATLSFVLDPEKGVSPVVVGGKVVGGKGSKLLVDLGSYAGRSFWLIKAGEAVGDFETVQVTGDNAKNVVVTKESNGWKAKIPCGIILIVR